MELVVLGMLTLIVLMAVVRPLLKKVLASEPIQVALVSAGGGAAVAGAEAMLATPDNPTARLVDFAQLNGKVQAETVQRVVDMVRASPSETVEVLRNWIHET